MDLFSFLGLKLIRKWLRAPIIEEDENGKKPPPKKSVKGTPQGGVISPRLANLYLHWFDVKFHRADGSGQWAKARRVRYADDLVILARYPSDRIDEWVQQELEGWMGLKLNREKTTVVRLHEKEALNFLGFSIRYDHDLFGRAWNDLNIQPSGKAMKKAREVLREKTDSKKCFKPTPEILEDINRYLRGWKEYDPYGYPRKAFRDLSHYARERMVVHLNRRSQRKYRRGKGKSHYEHLEELGLIRL